MLGRQENAKSSPFPAKQEETGEVTDTHLLTYVSRKKEGYGWLTVTL